MCPEVGARQKSRTTEEEYDDEKYPGWNEKLHAKITKSNQMKWKSLQEHLRNVISFIEA